MIFSPNQIKYIELINDIKTKLEVINISLIFDNSEKITTENFVKIAEKIKLNVNNPYLKIKNNVMSFYIYHDENMYKIKDINLSYFFDICCEGKKTTITTYEINVITNETLNKIKKLSDLFNELNNYINEYKLLFILKDNNVKNNKIKNILSNLLILETFCINEKSSVMAKYYIKKCAKHVYGISKNKYSYKVILYLILMNNNIKNKNNYKLNDKIIKKIRFNLIKINRDIYGKSKKC